jgi:hypothetical protein
VPGPFPKGWGDNPPTTGGVTFCCGADEGRGLGEEMWALRKAVNSSVSGVMRCIQWGGGGEDGGVEDVTSPGLFDESDLEEEN